MGNSGYVALSDRDLARSLYRASLANDEEALVLAENEVAHRLGIELDETEQGFTQTANQQVFEFVKRHYLDARPTEREEGI